ncbi:hypothetical protein [Nonomuraea sp. B19D2]|uniref:hypothetical protein n=1 Tax=Nonomuraea sp. B19D2 TaxID=3159561 RepID=UPI0032DB9AE6
MRTRSVIAPSIGNEGATARYTSGNGRRRRLLRRVTVVGTAAVSLAGLLASAPAASATPGNVYQTAAEVADNLNSMSWPSQSSHNMYATGDQSTSVVWGTPGTASSYFNRSKCATFVTMVLKEAWPFVTDQYLGDHFGSQSPTAAQYHDTFASGTSQFITSSSPALDQVTEIRSGTIIAVKYNAAVPDSGDPTGHVMIAAGTPVSYDRDSNNSTIEWAVPVIDSTTNPHGVASSWQGSPYHAFPDTRSVGTTEYDGVGRGWVFIRTDAENRPQGYWWGANEHLVNGFHSVANRPIAFGKVFHIIFP